MIVERSLMKRHCALKTLSAVSDLLAELDGELWEDDKRDLERVMALCHRLLKRRT